VVPRMVPLAAGAPTAVVAGVSSSRGALHYLECRRAGVPAPQVPREEEEEEGGAAEVEEGEVAAAGQCPPWSSSSSTNEG